MRDLVKRLLQVQGDEALALLQFILMLVVAFSMIMARSCVVEWFSWNPNCWMGIIWFTNM